MSSDGIQYNLTGQWTGKSHDGSLVIANFAHYGAKVTGRVSVLEKLPDNTRIWFWSYFEGNVDKDGNIDAISRAPSVFKQNHTQFSEEEREDVKAKYGVVFPTDNTHVKMKIRTNDILDIDWHTNYVENIERVDKVSIKRYTPKETLVETEKMMWDDFKKHALQQAQGTVYRGQSQNWALQTSFHRAGRADLVDYLDRILPDVERYTGATTGKSVNLSDYYALGGFLNLLQHHGFPTPLLDWTNSPYVAAFFAFEAKSISDKSDAIIFTFDSENWTKRWGNTVAVRTPVAEITTFVLPSVGNNRALPQQALTMYSNYHDIETLLKDGGGEIRAITIPASERQKVMKELELMGITWGSMYPGLDGLCKQLKYKHFNQ